MSVTNIKALLTPVKMVEVEYPGLPGFKIKLCYLSKDTLINIRKKSTKVTYKNRQSVEEVDDELFLKLYTQNTIKSWTGLTLDYLSKLVPVDLGDNDPNTEVDYSEENALDLIKNSSNFDNFVTEQVSDLGNF
jgi:hypothetical protein